MRPWRLLPWLITYAVAMAYVESAVVVYLRAIYYPQGFAFPLAPMPPDMVAIEIGREAATLVMLLGVGMLAGTGRWDRFLTFCVSFGVWDLFYYAWLWILLGWPPSLFTWDVLFLIPVPWIGPVLAPVVVSIALVGAGYCCCAKWRAVSPFIFRSRCGFSSSPAGCWCSAPWCSTFVLSYSSCSRLPFGGDCSVPE